ncbi:conserved hypothetical protein [Leishmania major strain Friedlin]|uniref:Membrane transporter protein n=1 Tax=Leishmania major TaxID=5664 RepID=E9AFI7_LEIMA|nr:conserved hypothetical protein [Leishmania major strain Friedlin]CAG9582718.1 membrane_transporter_protein_-_putative [Leishmania major strain Friedlin]CBZ12991.1 conserved hypothetical protein [Leishmania major strain Friedlin]|eukprot:XP_003722757.1 conserved hypothetical protein [Leishmania major strain Friedlin]
MSTHSYVDSENGVAIDNLSFASHISTSGRCVPADVESIAQAIASTSRRPEDGTPSTTDGEEAGLGMSADLSTMDIVKKFFFLGYPLTLSSLAQFSLNLVIIMVIGRLLGLEAMGGVSLALGLVNATGFAFGAGLCGALETVLSHSFGHFQQEKKRLAQAQTEAERTGTTVEPQVPCTLHIYGIYAQRMSIILMVACVPLGFVLCFADALLTIAGESAAVVHYTGKWCRWAVFGIPAAMAFQLIQRYYSCQHLTKPLPVALFSAAVANPILQLIFVKLFGFAGSPIAWLIMMTGIVAGLVFYLRYTGRDKLTWGGWDIRCAQNVNSLVKIALPSMGMMLSEWVALEVNALASGYGTAAELGAYTITLQVFGIMWAMGSGVMILTSVFVGNAIGEGKPLLARRIAFIALAVVLGIATVDVVLCLLLQPFIPSFFVQAEEVDAVAAIYRELMYVVMPYHFVDVFQSTVMGALRGCELQKLGAVIITVAFCAVGVPLSFLLFFHFKIGIKALWIGPFTGVAVVGTPVYIYILLRYIKWENLKPHADNTAILEETETGAARTRAISNPVDIPLDNAAASVESPQVVAVRRFVNSPTPITTVQVPTAASVAEKPQQ